MSTINVQIDPHSVLGLAAGASLQEIRDAYRAKAKLYHPDKGGEDWAFRILVQSYEVLSTERVVRATRGDSRPAPTPGPAPGPEPRKEPRFDRSNPETAWPGPSDVVGDPTRVVDVEKLWVRYEVDHVWLLQGADQDSRFLSCCLNVTWPFPPSAEAASLIKDAPQVIAQLHDVFDAMCMATKVISSQCDTLDDRFAGWLSYPNAARATAAIAKLRELLHARGLAIRTWNRDMLIPRDWR